MSARGGSGRGLTAAACVGIASAGLFASFAGAARPCAAAELSSLEQERLLRGETLVFEKTMVSDTRRYIGGVTYTVVGASVDEMAAILEDASAYERLLPRTKEARVVAPPPPSPSPASSPHDFFVELRQGNALLETTYTLHVRSRPEERTVRFWLDPTRPHGVDDAWGFFRYEPVAFRAAGGDRPAVLLTYGVLVDLGPGIVRELFEERVRSVLLSVPSLVRQYVQNGPGQGRGPKKS